METKTDNELIAEFIGLERAKANRDYFFIREYSAYVAPDNILYHKSWDWLMPVVEKIERMHDIVFAVEIHIGAGCRIYADGKDIEKMDDGINCVYKAVVEFIKWYNEQNR